MREEIKPGQPQSSNYFVSNDESDKIQSNLITFYDLKGNEASKQARRGLQYVQEKVQFKAYVTDFSDDFSSNWSSTNVYGRMDPVYNYENTTRKITISFDVPSFDIEEAAWNATKISKLVQYTYPVYNAVNNRNRYESGINRHIVMPPIIGASFGNLMQGVMNGLPIPGFLEGASINPDFDAGVFEYRDNTLVRSVAEDITALLAENASSPSTIKQRRVAELQTPGSPMRYFFKLYKVNLTFNPIHSQLLGHTFAANAQEHVRFQSFPGGLRMTNYTDRTSPVSTSNSKIKDTYNQSEFA